MHAIAAVKSSADSRAVNAAVRAVYLPWLDQAAGRLQGLAASEPLPHAGQQPMVSVDAGTCLLFADGLRFDLAQRLAASLNERGLQVVQKQRWAALPSVTATAKPAVAPIAEQIHGAGLPDTFAPEIKSNNQSLTTPRFRKLLGEAGYQVIPSGETGDAGEPNARGWCECGKIDRKGHDLQIGLANQLEHELDLLVERVTELLDAGWRAVRVVTDHGWLLMPNGLPKEDLPHYLTESKWSRCATIKGQSRVSVPKAGWHWNPTAEFACAPGAACFVKGKDYAHGGISLQECLIADLTVRPSEEGGASTASITDIRWLGLRCRVTVAPPDTSLSIDLRTKPNASTSTIAVSTKRLDGDGKAGLVVEDEDLSGSVAVVVVLDAEGRVLTKRPTTVGGED